MKFCFTPTAASRLNRIESHFTALKKFALDNSDYRSHPQMQKAIRRYLRWRNGDRRISSHNWTTYKPHPSDFHKAYRKTG